MRAIRGPLGSEGVIASAWDARGWHGFRRRNNQTSVPLAQGRRIHARLRRQALPFSLASIWDPETEWIGLGCMNGKTSRYPIHNVFVEASEPISRSFPARNSKN